MDTGLNADQREVLGLAREDLWYYAAFPLLIAGCFFSSEIAVAGLFGVSTVLVGIYLWKSFPKYISGQELSRGVRIYGFLGNVFIVCLQIAVIGLKVLVSFVL